MSALSHDQVDPSENRRGRLLGIKLSALVAEHVGHAVDVDTVGFAGGAGLVVDGDAWVLIDGPAHRGLGPALAWAIRHDAASVNLIAETDTGLLARRAGRFEFPIAVWFPVERILIPAVAEALPTPPDPHPDHLALVPMIEEAGAEPNVEHGVVSGEVRGLEVCRVVDEPTTGRLLEADGAVPVATRQFDGVQLEVGVGPTDREAFQLLHGHVPTVEALATVVGAVSTHRSTDAPQHPLNRMAPERLLRWESLRDPALVGARHLRSVAPPVPRPGMKQTAPCLAEGERLDGEAITIVFTSGVDLDLVPFLADIGTPNDVVVAGRERDLVTLTRDLAHLLTFPVDFVTIDRP